MAVVGALIANRYRLIRVIGAGGMGRVWFAFDTLLTRDVAIKEIVTSFAIPGHERTDLNLRMVREGRAAARLNHPNVIGIYDVVLAGGRPWLVMEYFPGWSLDVVIAQGGPLTPRTAARVGVQLLAALAAAHDLGVLHRDVKPQNVLIGQDGRVVLSDFGLAVFDNDTGATRTGVLVASPHYVAPERARDGASTVEADLWSLGATLYAAVEGRAPYARHTAMETLAALATEEPDPTTRAGALQPVIAGLMSRNPTERLTAAGAEQMLREVAGMGTGTDPGVIDLSPVGAGPAAAGRDRRRSLRRGVAIGAGALALSAVVSVAVSVGDPANSGRIPSDRGTAWQDPSGGAAACLRPAVAAATTAVGIGDGSGARALPTGWLWHDDPAGFRIAVPETWLRTTDGVVVCFRDPVGSRTLAVDPSVASTTDPVGYWRREEESLLATAGPPGYRNLGIELSVYQRSAADWQYSWDRGEGRRWRTLRRVFTTPGGRGFALAWTTPDFDWALNQPNFRILADSFAAA